ncbi:hypothetical protein RclHR1_02200016 [Rhizophagus clarus]|uniref:Choice-of-anchor G family protein n=1 Tax=Rhizophagus clarus TaxID=94130 RepID=A0A2Z6QVI7_9GLOM|nr:hypothetical protein RclHR1_02200016 [Rhizophagus clarus]GES79604.1 choice-of-anchor G family protein [Rhizophagus clarus]
MLRFIASYITSNIKLNTHEEIPQENVFNFAAAKNLDLFTTETEHSSDEDEQPEELDISSLRERKLKELTEKVLLRKIYRQMVMNRHAHDHLPLSQIQEKLDEEDLPLKVLQDKLKQKENSSIYTTIRENINFLLYSKPPKSKKSRPTTVITETDDNDIDDDIVPSTPKDLRDYDVWDDAIIGHLMNLVDTIGVETTQDDNSGGTVKETTSKVPKVPKVPKVDNDLINKVVNEVLNEVRKEESKNNFSGVKNSTFSKGTTNVTIKKEETIVVESSVKNTEKNTAKNTEKSTVKNTEKNTAKNTEKSTVKNTEKNTVKNTGKNTVKNTGKNTMKNTEKNTIRNLEINTTKNTGKNTVKNTGKNSVKSTENNASTNIENNVATNNVATNAKNNVTTNIFATNIENNIDDNVVMNVGNVIAKNTENDSKNVEIDIMDNIQEEGTNLESIKIAEDIINFGETINVAESLLRSDDLMNDNESLSSRKNVKRKSRRSIFSLGQPSSSNNKNPVQTPNSLKRNVSQLSRKSSIHSKKSYEIDISRRSSISSKFSFNATTDIIIEEQNEDGVNNNKFFKKNSRKSIHFLKNIWKNDHNLPLANNEECFLSSREIREKYYQQIDRVVPDQQRKVYPRTIGTAGDRSDPDYSNFYLSMPNGKWMVRTRTASRKITGTQYVDKEFI